MRLWIVSSLVMCMLASPTPGVDGYDGGISDEYVDDLGDYDVGGGGISYQCGPKQLLNSLGHCVDPIYTENVFFYNAPPAIPIHVPSPKVPPPKIDYDLVFLRAPDTLPPPAPIVVPANEKRTAVFLLNKNQPIHPQRVIEVPPAPQQSPEVFYVNYDHGDNPVLPGGVSLQEALAAADVHPGQLIDSGVRDGAYHGTKFGVAGGQRVGGSITSHGNEYGSINSINHKNY